MVAVAPYPHRVAMPRAHVLAGIIGYVALIDLLFLPYFQRIILPFSLPLILLTPILVGTTIKRDRYFYLFAALALFVLVGAAVSAALPEHTIYATENVKRALQLLSAFAYYFYFRWLGERTELKVTPIIVVFIAWFAGLGVAFFIAPTETHELIRAFYGRLVTSEQDVAFHLRFGYLFTDPNSAGYFFLIASAMLLLKQRSAVFLVAFIAVALGCVFLTQSSGALIAFSLMIGATLYPPKVFLRSLLSVRKWLIGVVVCVAVFGFFYYISDAATSNTIAKIAFDRVFGSSERYLSGSGRFDMWSRFVTNLVPLPIGRGYVLQIDGVVQGTHSDLLRLTYSYGVFAVVPAVCFFFGRFISLTPLILPALMAFLVNSLLDEQKLLALFLSLLALASVAADKQAQHASSMNAKNVA
jgi:hypothetical protein